MKILFIGDIVGRPGREATVALLPELRKEFSPDLVIANGENLSQGKGINERHAQEMKKKGIDFFTTGNHVWKQPTVFPMMDEEDTFVIRPANYPDSNPGKGYQIVDTGEGRLLIINLQGRTFVKEATDDPFKKLDQILEETASEELEGIFVDFHAEATSEKVCFGLYAAERVSAVVGTHTHVPTADDHILKDHTAYITDVGNVGLLDSAIGIDAGPVIQHFLTQMPIKHTITPGGPVQLNAVIIELDAGKAKSIQRIQREYTPN
jgi:hypothetical protein